MDGGVVDGVKSDGGKHLRFIYLCHNKSVFRRLFERSTTTYKDTGQQGLRLVLVRSTVFWVTRTTQYILATIIGLLLLCQ